MRQSFILLAAVLATLTAPQPAAASFGATVRARPLRVVPLPPNSDGLPMVRIGGVFALVEFGTMRMLAPRCGSIDFFCNGDVALCRQEWDDFSAAAAAGRCVGASLRLWSVVDVAVEPATATVHNANPYVPTLGVVDIPCRPEPPSAERPDLTIPCDVGPWCQVGADAAVGDPDAPPPGTDEPPNADMPPSGPCAPSADATLAARPARRFGCTVGGAGSASPAAAAVLVVLALRRRRRT